MPPENANEIAVGIDKVTRQVRLADIWLVKNVSSRELVEELPVDHHIQQMSFPDLHREKGRRKEFGVLWTMGVRGLANEPTDETAPIEEELFRIEATYFLKYTLQNATGIKIKDIEEFMSINSIIHVWPFWREYVHQQTARMALPIITLNIRPPHKKLTELIQESQNNL